MKKIFMLLLTAAIILPMSCTESTDDPGKTGTDNPQPEPEPEPEPEPVKTYEVGEYYNEGLAKGVVAYVDETGEHGLVLSLDEGITIWSEEMICLTNYNILFTMEDGAYNTQLIKDLVEGWKDKYPAFAWADKKNAPGLKSWYLPSPYELEFASFGLEAINATLNELGAELIKTGPNDAYWTSTEVGIYDAYTFSFYYGEISSYDTKKNLEHYVRAMRKF